MKTIFFVQHGIALTRVEDEQRPLSSSGTSEVRRVAERLKNHHVVVSKVYHSGKLRAQQTAGLFAQVLTSLEVSEQAGMNPNDDPSILIGQLNHDFAMYVGHLPHVQRVVSKLVADNENLPAIRFQNAAVACVEIDEEFSSLKWFITPDLC